MGCDGKRAGERAKQHSTLTNKHCVVSFTFPKHLSFCPFITLTRFRPKFRFFRSIHIIIKIFPSTISHEPLSHASWLVSSLSSSPFLFLSITRFSSSYFQLPAFLISLLQPATVVEYKIYFSEKMEAKLEGTNPIRWPEYSDCQFEDCADCGLVILG